MMKLVLEVGGAELLVEKHLGVAATQFKVFGHPFGSIVRQYALISDNIGLPWAFSLLNLVNCCT